MVTILNLPFVWCYGYPTKSVPNQIGLKYQNILPQAPKFCFKWKFCYFGNPELRKRTPAI